MKIRIWGARGSIPSPLTPQDVEEKIFKAILGLPDINTKDPEAVRSYIEELPSLLRGTAGGNTSCVEIQVGQQTFIIDAGSGIRGLGQALATGPCGRGEGTIHLLLTHPHWDHIQGFPFFLPAFIPGNRVYIYSVHDMERYLTEQQSPRNWPISVAEMPAQLEFIRVEPGRPFSIGDVTINTIENVHPGKAYAFRFDDGHSIFVHASDAEYKQLNETSLRPYLDFFKDADVLIFDAQFTQKEAWEKVGWGHSSSLIGADMARRAGVKKLILFHHDPTYSDEQLQKIQSTTIAYQAQDTTRPTCEVLIAQEGLTIDLTPPGAVDLHYTPGDDIAILTPTAIFDERGATFLEQQLARLTELGWPACLIVDLSYVESFSMAGLKSLISLRRDHEHASIVLVGLSARTKQVIELAGFLNFFATYPSVEAALSALQARAVLHLSGQFLQERYRIESKIGDGRLGTVFKSFDSHLEQDVAIKILSASFSEEAIQQFLQQARQIQELDHPNIVNVFGCDRDGGFPYIVEEYVIGTTLRDRLNGVTGPPLSLDEALDIGVDMALALEHAHSCGVIHGDLKPKNVLLSDRVKISDFGLGRLEEGHNLLEAPLVMLTAAYLAPEQVLGQPLDARTDLYALGVILYELFTGQPPFSGDEQQIMEAHLHETPASLRATNPNISPSLEHLVLKLLAKNPNERYASAQQVHRISSSMVVNTEAMTRQHRRPLIGREKQIEQIQKIWQEAQAGHGQLIFIRGEPGIGKTHLAQAAAARTDTSILLTGACQETASGSIYQPIVEALTRYFATVPPELSDKKAQMLLANFAQLIPNVEQMQPNLSLPPQLEPKQEHLRLMTSLTQFIKRATQDRPWLLILDDLQWADQSMLELLHYLARHTPSMALLIICTYRDTDITHNHPLRRMLRDLDRYPTYHRLSLTRLSQSEVGQFLANLWQEEVIPNPLTEEIYRCTNGNPFYVEEVARGLIDDGIITLTAGGLEFPNLSTIRLPQSIHDAVLHRINYLSRGTQVILYQAAVLGQTFNFADLQETSGLSELEVLERLDVALERQLVQEAPGDMVLRFAHPEIQRVLYDDLGPLRRRMLHHQAAEALERRYQPRPEQISETLAHHYSEANVLDKAIHYSLHAAGQSQAAFANQASLTWYTKALTMLASLNPEEALQFQNDHPKMHEAIGDILALLGQYDEALKEFKAAWSFIEQQPETGQRVKRPHQLAALCYKIATVYEKQSEYDQAFTWLEKGLSGLDDEESTIEAAHLYMSGAEIYQRRGDNQQAITWGNKSMAMAQRIETPQGQKALAYILYKLSHIYLRRGEATRALAFCHQSIEIYEAIGDIFGQSQAYLSLTNAFSDRGEWDKAEEGLRKSLDMKQEIGDIFGQGVIANNLANLHLDQGQWDEAIYLFQESLFIWNQINARFHKAETLSNMAQAYINQNDWTQARHYLQQSQAIFTEIGSEAFLPELERRWSELSLKTNDLDLALSHIQRSIELAVAQADVLEEAKSRRLLGQIHLARQEQDLAETALQQSMKILVNLENRFEMAKTTLPLIQVTIHNGKDNGVETHLADAIQTFERLGAQIELEEALKLEKEINS